MDLKNNKKSLVLSIVALLAIILLLAGATYAFFQAQFGAGADANVNVTTNTVDQLSFRMFNNTPEDTDPAGISITANQDNFNETDRQNVTGITYGTATFTANNKTANAEVKEEITKTYNMYLDISENDFEYTTAAPDQKAELILTIMYSPTGNDADLTEYTAQIEGLNRTTVEGITGYDVTKAKGLIKIAEDYEIKALSGATTTHKWKITLTFVNLDSNQNANTDKTFSAALKMQKDKAIITLSDHIKQLYTTDGENSLYLHDVDLTNGANDNSYRYAGANPNNYVCFGTDATPCPDDNLYRIIGVFNEKVIGADGNPTEATEERVKLIKNTSIGNIAWDSNNTNTWSTATLNTATLNGTYLTGLGDYANKIASTRWHVGGGDDSQLVYVTAKIAYQNEIGTPVNNITYDTKIGLMYVSDYGFAASPESWTKRLDSYNSDININNNWMYLGKVEWTITTNSDLAFIVSNVLSAGHVDGASASSTAEVRPTFSLESSATYGGGEGTETNPIRIN